MKRPLKIATVRAVEFCIQNSFHYVLYNSFWKLRPTSNIIINPSFENFLTRYDYPLALHFSSLF
jgi:hypothetical protein